MKTIEEATEIFLRDKRVQNCIFSHIASDVKNTDSCWKWVGALSGGHPTCAVQGKAVRVRGLLYRALLRRRPRVHPYNLCDNNSCVNPWHCGEKSSRRRKYFATMEIISERLFPSSVAYQCKNYHPVIGPNKLKNGACRICMYLSIERHSGTPYGLAIRRIEKELERLAGGKSYNWNPECRGKIGKRGGVYNGLS